MGVVHWTLSGLKSSKEVIVKGKICFIVLSVILAVSLGCTSDIRAYTYSVKTQTAVRNENETISVTSNTNTDRSQIIEKDLLRDASETVDELIADQIAYAQPVVTLNNDQMEAAEGTHEYYSSGDEEYTDQQNEDYEIEVLRRIVMAEAGSEDIQGQIMVANVVLNRIAAGYGETISEIVFMPGQFQPVTTGSFWSVVPTESVIEACNRALAGEDYSNGALFFVSSVYGDTSWFFSDLVFVAEHGDHLFFK